MDRIDYELEMEVRDYECDLQGIVNNANYLHYIEHTRHRFILDRGISFADLHNRGIDVVVARMNLNYKVPLRSDDRFRSVLQVGKKGVCYVFQQEVRRLPDDVLCMKAQVDCACLVNGRLGKCPELDALIPVEE